MLFAIGIVTVGLLGVMTLIPVAGARLSRGAIADRADRLGRNAIHEFRVQHMANPHRWAYYRHDPVNPRFYDPVYRYSDPGPEDSGRVEDDVKTHGAFCIDPLVFSSDYRSPRLSVFPSADYPTDIPRMRRITLRRILEEAGAARIEDPEGGEFYRYRRVTRELPWTMAQEYFTGTDDLVLQLEGDLTGIPQLKYSFDEDDENDENDEDKMPVKRQDQGAFSWMATLTPKPHSPSDLYLLSIVVFHRRLLGQSDVEGGMALDEERVSEVDADFFGGGLAGGDLRLRSSDSRNLEMKQGEWVMLLGRENDRDYFQWYLVQAAGGDPDPGGSEFTRDVTLFGRDWIVPPTLTRLVWIPGIVGVFERTVRLETSSLWTAQ